MYEHNESFQMAELGIDNNSAQIAIPSVSRVC